MINKKRLINTFTQLVKIDSPSGEEEQISDFLAKKLKNLGIKVKKDSYGNLIGKVEGKGKPLMLNAHLDTVEPGRNIKPQIEKGIIKSDGTTVLGADPKAGIAIILETVESLKEEKVKHIPLEIVLTREEETSLGGAINLDYTRIESKEGLVLDGDEEVFKIFVSSPTYYSLDVEITGKSAHAGVEPEKGISAIEIAAKIIHQLKLGRIDRETTFNIGVIQGGIVRNAVPDKTTFNGEIRSRNLKTLEKIIKETEEIFEKVSKSYPDAKINFSLKKDFDGFKLNKNHRLIKKARNVFKGLKLKPILKDSGGGSDANIFFSHNLETIIVGTGVWEPHTIREYLVMDQTVNAAKFCEEFIKENHYG